MQSGPWPHGQSLLSPLKPISWPLSGPALSCLTHCRDHLRPGSLARSCGAGREWQQHPGLVLPVRLPPPLPDMDTRFRRRGRLLPQHCAVVTMTPLPPHQHQWQASQNTERKRGRPGLSLLGLSGAAHQHAGPAAPLPAGSELQLGILFDENFQFLK